MGQGYTRNDTANNIADGNIINASDLDGEFDALQAAFAASTGHSHDGTSGEGPQIDTAGLADDAVTAAKLDDTASFTMAGLTVSGAVALNGSTTIGNADTDTVTVTADVASSLIPSADATHDLGAVGSEWNDLYVTGTANIDALVADTADINAGSIDGVTIGTNSAVTDLRVDNLKIDGNTISSTDTAGDITLTPDGTGNVNLSADTVRVGDSGVDATVTTNGAGDLIINTNAGSSSGSIRIYDGADGNINLTPNGTGSVVISKADINGGAIDATNIGAATAGTGNFSTLSIGGTAVTSTAAEINILDGATLDVNELNILDGVTSTTAELNLLDGSVAGTVTNNKAVIYGASGQVNANTLSALSVSATTLNVGGVAITATPAEINLLDGVTSTTDELSIVDGDTTATSTTLVDADRLVVNDNGTMVQVAMTDVQTYVNANLDADVVKKDENNTFTAAQRGSTDTDTTNTGSVTLNFDTNQNFVLTLTGNVTLANPTTEAVGQSGFIVFIQDATGGRTVSLGTDYETAGGAGLTLSSTASATDVVPYIVAASGRVLLGTPQLAFS